MTYINVGAKNAGGQRIATKSALRLLFTSMPETITFDSTAALGPEAGKTFPGNELPAGYKLQVVGPDPYTKRVWYATVEQKRDGSWKVS